MILTAQHVRAPTGAEGINAFCRMHGPRGWTDSTSGDPAGDLAAGELVNQAISIPPGGNEVRSYLDVIAPDETTTQELRSAVVLFVDRSRGRTLPWAETIGRCTFRFGVEQALHASWPEEFRQLLLSALSVRRAT
jgi:hypothetical protein